MLAELYSVRAHEKTGPCAQRDPVNLSGVERQEPLLCLPQGERAEKGTLPTSDLALGSMQTCAQVSPACASELHMTLFGI